MHVTFPSVSILKFNSSYVKGGYLIPSLPLQGVVGKFVFILNEPLLIHMKLQMSRRADFMIYNLFTFFIYMRLVVKKKQAPYLVVMSYYLVITGKGLIIMRKDLVITRSGSRLISMSILRRHLKSLVLFRRKGQSDLLEVALFLQGQLNQYFNQSSLFVTCNHIRYNHSEVEYRQFFQFVL